MENLSLSYLSGNRPDDQGNGLTHKQNPVVVLARNCCVSWGSCVLAQSRLTIAWKSDSVLWSQRDLNQKRCLQSLM